MARRLNVEIAAVSPQMKEIYINPIARLTQEEWKFVLAHEFLHAALRHDARCEDREGVPYLEYVAKMKDNPVARTVKLADLEHNSELGRLEEVDEAALKRVEKYKKARAILRSKE